MTKFTNLAFFLFAMNCRYKFLLIFISFLSLSIDGYCQFYTGAQVQFGKNRVRYEKLVWQYYDYGDYKVYYSQGGDKIAEYVAARAKEYMSSMATFMDVPTPTAVNFLVYNNVAVYKESSLGLITGVDYNIGGTNEVVGKKVAVYFDGNHEHLDEQIRLGLAQVMFREMMYGGSFANVIKSSALLNIPPWFEQGFVNFAARGWTAETDNFVRDGIESGRYKKFNHLTGVDATYAGISIWNYIAQTYGESVIPQMLYIARTSRSIESAFVYSLGTGLKDFTKDWLNYYAIQYKKDTVNKVTPATPALIKKPKKNAVYFKLEASPNGRYVAYSTNVMGQEKVWLYDTQTKKKQLIYKEGHKINRILDYSAPLIAWHPSGELFSFIIESKGNILLCNYTIDNHKLQKNNVLNFQKILDFSYSDDGTKFVMSAMRNGQSDIYIFTVSSYTYEQITDDVYDDLNPRFIDHSTKIIFSSNRPDDTIRKTADFSKMQDNFDIFVYNYKTHSNVLRRITNTPEVDESYPAGYSNNYVEYLSNATGIVNRYLAYVDSVISFVDTAAHYRYIVHSYPITNFQRSIMEQDVAPFQRYYTQIFYFKGRYYLYEDTLPASIASTPETFPGSTVFMKQYLYSIRKKKMEDSLTERIKNDTNYRPLKVNTFKPQSTPTPVVDTSKKAKIDTAHKNLFLMPVNINDYSFEEAPAPGNNPVSNLPVPASPKKPPAPIALNSNATIISDTATKPKKKHPLVKEDYEVSFSPSEFGFKMNDAFYNQSYQPFTGWSGPSYQSPSLGIGLNGEMQDLFEDYRISGGGQAAFGLGDNEYYLKYEDYSGSVGQEFTIHRVSLLDVTDQDELVNLYTLEGTYTLKFPISEVSRIETSIGLMDDKMITLGQDQPSLQTPDNFNYWDHFDLNYIYDATIPVALNINYGLRARLYAQYYNDYLSAPNSNMVILGMDVRYYQKISRDLVWANRLSGGTSVGQEHLLYYLGGVDNWIGSSFMSATGLSNQTYAFQTIADPMRGFDQNVRNGTDYILYNSEIRFPVFHYLLNQPIKSDLINNLQLITFFDIGTAWTGANPYSTINSINTTVVSAPGNPITVIISTQQYPFVEGFGEGIRTRILGYFARLDVAWGVDNDVISSTPEVTFSLGLDF